MYENSKSFSARQSQCFGRPLQALRDVEPPTLEPAPATNREKTTSRAAMEYFGRAAAELLDCKSCYVATMFPNATSGLVEVRIGNAKAGSSCTATVERIARQGSSSDCTLVDHVNARTNFVRKLIGVESGGKGHSVIGRISTEKGATAVFVAGWRPAALLTAEIPCVARAIRMIWETTQTAFSCPVLPRPDGQTWLEDLTFPAIVVDEDLSIHDANGSGRALLTRGEFLKSDRGMLSGLCFSVTENLKKALSEVLKAQGRQGWLNTTVPLSVDHQRFAFARMGAVPGDPGKILVIVPQFDEISGASRIASAFGLTWAEERIIARILQGQCPRHIGSELHLTEATVRTYTKRIMLKLGINRQSEFFLLYHLTLSPFGATTRDRARINRMSSSDFNRRAH